MSLVFLEYSFMFNPDEAWQHVNQFEQDFAKFLDERGFEAETIKGIGEGAGKRILFISKKPDIGPPPEEPKMKSKKRLKAMQMTREGGKFGIRPK
ncbi:hypothetical protein LCGC14_0971040 [marine sediment metagenome]|uniref:Uncharacterized protein n=1 Tax=marine sediment metagenome TaxID=412755 RepID=A0A0F9NG25_9ZZZZ